MKRENKWPFFGTIIFSDPYFKLGSRTPYIDVPNGFIGRFLSEIQELTKKYKSDKEKLYDEAMKLKNDYNKYFEKNYGDWLRLVITSLQFGEKPFGIQMRIKWNKFYSFLEDFAKREDISLEEKYQYLASCRYSAIPLIIRKPLTSVLDKRLERVQNSVNEIGKKDREGIHSKINSLVAQLEKIKSGLFSISKRRSITNYELANLEYFPEIISTLQGIDILAQNGLLTSCYREMRKIVENLYWMVSNDILLLKLLKNAERIEGNDIIFFISPYRGISKAWHEWARNNNATLSHIKELKEKIQLFAEFIRLYGRMKEYNWGKERIANTLIDNLSYSSFLLFTGIERPGDEEGRIDFIPSYETKTLQMLAEEDLKNAIRQLKGKSLSKSDEKLVEESLKMKTNRLGKFIIPLYPSNEFVIQFVSKNLHLGDIDNRYYGRYSYFVHSYDTSWQIFPFSSVLEFKILKYELSTFCDMIVGTFDKFFDRLNYRGKYLHKI